MPEIKENTSELVIQCDFLVEVLVRYSNLSDQGERLRDLLEIVPNGSPEVNFRTPKRVIHRLEPPEIERLREEYLSGSAIQELADRFGVHRSTVTVLLNRAGVVRRPVESQPVVYEIVRCDVPRINLFCDW